MRKYGAKTVALGGRERRDWLETKGRPPIAISFSPPASEGSSSMPCMILGLVGLLGGGPKICGVSVEMRTQFCLRCPLRAFGLPFSADGFCSGALSHWKGFPLLLREESCVAFDACRLGVHALPLMSRSTPVLGLSAGEPFSDTVVEQRETLRGFLTPESLLKELTDETLRMLIRSAVPRRGIESRLVLSLSSEELKLVVESWRLSSLSPL